MLPVISKANFDSKLRILPSASTSFSPMSYHISQNGLCAPGKPSLLPSLRICPQKQANHFLVSRGEVLEENLQWVMDNCSCRPQTIPTEFLLLPQVLFLAFYLRINPGPQGECVTSFKNLNQIQKTENTLKLNLFQTCLTHTQSCAFQPEGHDLIPS